MTPASTPATPGKPSTRDIAGFLDRLRRLVLDEAITAREEMSALWAKPMPARVGLGRAIEGVRIVKVHPNGLIDLECDRNLSRFREGDLLNLNRGSPYFQPHFHVTLEADDDTRLTVLAEELGFNWGEVFTDKTDWTLDEDYLDLSRDLLDALAQAGDSTVGRERILPLLMGYGRPAMDMTRYERALSMADLFGLNWSQSEAFAQSYATDLCYLIQGPPGTGKTRVLAHLAQALVEDGERVLITAFTHRAINNALDKLAEVAPDTPAIKVGQSSRADGLLVENYESFDASPMAEMKEGYAVGGTPFATRSSRLGGVEVETVIFDEASQITLPLAIMGMLPAKKYIFIGDEKQLPPVLRTRRADRALHESVFGRLSGRGFDTMLTETYRLSAELAEWPSRQFYGGALMPVDEVAQHRVAYNRVPSRLIDTLDPDQPKVFLDLMHRNASTRSQLEASTVVDLIVELLACGVLPDEIGVVAPYRAQGRAIRNLLRQAVHNTEARRSIIVDTVERMQGQERDVVIFSMTTSNPTFAAELADFFFQPERLNVAVTRPRKKLIIVGSSHVLRADPPDPDLQATVALLRDLLSTCARRMLDYAT